MSQWYVYMIRATDQSLYTGITTDVERRFAEHQAGRAGAKYFRGRSPEQVMTAVAPAFVRRKSKSSPASKNSN